MYGCRGGVNQRNARHAAEHLPPPGMSALAFHLVEQWAYGVFSPQQVQKLASAAHVDVTAARTQRIEFADLARLARLGSSGQQTQHAHSELLRSLKEPYYASPHTFPMPMQLKPNVVVRDSDQQMFLPHEVFASLWDNYPESFKSKLCPSDDILNEFWSSMETSPQLRAHPMVHTKPNFKRRAIPYGLHGDGVPVVGVGKSWNQSADFFSWTFAS